MKRETPVHFESDIYLDRYLLENKSLTTERRKTVAKLKAELSKLKDELKTYTHYNNSNIGIDEALATVIHYSREKEKTSKPPSLP